MRNFTVQSNQSYKKRNSSVKKVPLLQPLYRIVYTPGRQSRHFEKLDESALKGPS